MTDTTSIKISAKQLHDSHRWIPLDEISLLPGNPNLGHEDSLEASLDEFGWIDGIVVHNGTVIAGNHRVKAAQAANEEGLPGYDLSSIPLDDARRMAIALAHNHTGRMGTNDPQLLAEALIGLASTDQGLAELAGWNDLQGKQLRAVTEAALENGLDAPPGGFIPDSYTRKVEVPTYSPTTEKAPPISGLTDSTVTDRLKADIRAAKLPRTLTEFLLRAAERHTRFNYDLIAEYYSHTDPAIQKLMEESALVIIDYDQAIELGFLKLTESFREQFKTDQPR